MKIRSITELDNVDFDKLPDPASSKKNCMIALNQFGEIQIFFSPDEVLSDPELTPMDIAMCMSGFSNGAYIVVIYPITSLHATKN